MMIMDIKNNFEFYHGVLRFEDVNGSVKPMRISEKKQCFTSVRGRGGAPRGR